MFWPLYSFYKTVLSIVCLLLIAACGLWCLTCLTVGVCVVLQRGRAVEVNHKLSLELFRRAAELGDPQGQGMMGMRMAVGLHHYHSFEGASIRQFGPVSNNPLEGSIRVSRGLSSDEGAYGQCGASCQQ